MTGKSRFQSRPATSSSSQDWVRGISQPQTASEDKVLAVFQPDILISAQYLSTYRRRFHLNPEQVLMLAVLEDAVICFQENVKASCKRKRALHVEAQEWIMDPDKGYLFSFENICDALGLEPQYVRQGLLRWKNQTLAVAVEHQVNRWPSKRVNKDVPRRNAELPRYAMSK